MEVNGRDKIGRRILLGDANGRRTVHNNNEEQELPRLCISKMHSGVVLLGKAVISAAFCDVVIAI